MDGSDTNIITKRAGEMAALMKTLSHPNRLLIACELMKGECSVSEIEDASGVRQPVLSRELARLRDENLVDTRRESKLIFYRLRDARLRQLMEVLCHVFGGSAMPSPQADQGSAQGFPTIEGQRARRVRLTPDPYRKD